ncbi:MAG: FAD-dependent oxidoreductase [Verrucomicrobiota bacterium]|nr:FAD-dependent oxidoreductase [Verrucomicrobiota bacterium]
MKTIVIGNNHAGTAAITHLRKRHPDMEVVSYDKNDNISFLACGIALWIGGTIKQPDGLFYSSPEHIRELGAEVNMKHDVTDIDFEAKKIHLKDMETGKEFDDKYDKLILAMGSWPIIPPIPGIDLKGIHISKLYQHANSIIENVKKTDVKKVTVVGAGYIGIELVEAFHKHGKEVTLIEAEDRILCKYFDDELTVDPENNLKEKGINVQISEKVIEFKGENGHVTKIITDKGEHETDMVIFSVGFRPNSELIKDKLDTLPNGAIKVNDFMQTSHKDVFACGDCAAVYSNATGQNEYIALATNAVRMGIMCAINIKENTVAFPGVQGSNAIKIFDYNMASTGLSETSAKAMGLKVSSNIVEDASRAEFMPSYDQVKLKIVYETQTRRLVGAQISSKGDYTLAIHTFSLAIQKQMSVDEFALTDFFFLPHFNKPVSYMTSVALTAP